MKTRLYFLLPDEDAAKGVAEALRAEDIDDEHIYAVANHDKYTLDEEIPEAGLQQTSNVANAAKRGAVIGGAAGVFAGLTAAAVAPLGLVAAGGAIAALGLGGAAAGTWSSSMIGVSVPNTDLKAFQDAVDEGQILMLADVEGEQIEQIRGAILSARPDTVINSGALQD
jgi:hypothetical protein